jgi:hypothetical protein
MDTIHVETTIESDGILCVGNLPCRKGDRVEATIVLHDQQESERREAALQRLLARARRSPFRSAGLYPSRDELHERR